MADAPFINPATGEPVPYADFVDKQMPTTYEQIAAALRDPNWWMEVPGAAAGMTGAPAGAIMSGFSNGAKSLGKMGAVSNSVADAWARAREMPGQAADYFRSMGSDVRAGFRGGNVTQAEQQAVEAQRRMAEFAQRRQEMARQMELERTQAPRFRGQVPPEDANWHEIANALRAFEDSAPYSMRTPDGRSMSQADTYFELGRLLGQRQPPAGMTAAEVSAAGPRFPTYEEFLASRLPPTP